MFTSYDMKPLGTKIRSIRKNLNFELHYVSEVTGLCLETLRKLEKGLGIPKFDTLDKLSQLYKVDLIVLLGQYKRSHNFLTIYEELEKAVLANDLNLLLNVRKKLSACANYETLGSTHAEYEQLTLFIETIILTHDDNYSLPLSIEKMVDTIKITVPTFSLNTYKNQIYNLFEIRMIFYLASLLSKDNRIEASNDLLNYFLNLLALDEYSSQIEIQLDIKIISLLAVNTFSSQDYQESLKYADRGIALCVKYHVNYYLDLLLYSKGIAKFKLAHDDYKIFLNHSRVLLKIFGYQSDEDEMNRKLKLIYGIEI